MRERLTRALWPALVLIAFCFPLFVGLGNLDLRGDEAGHSFSVDRILETGEWLVPKMSPHPDAPFLEKPPLKFWLVAAGIKAGLPHDEFGLRFWDPVFGGIAFLYVFAIGRRLDGPLCGVVAVLLLFVNRNLLFEHGLRDNNMEAPLLLSYCGGVFHYLAWTSSPDARRRGLHALAVTLYFALGFMVKFVAALFLPLVLGLTTLLVPRYRRQALGDWRLWAGAILAALAVILPWFVYASVEFGRLFWEIILGTQVVTRLTSYLDPAHLNPWHHYLSETYGRWKDADAFWLIAGGAVLLVVETIRRRSAEGLLVIVWFAVPVTIISVGTSKLYHYAYPFLPPVGLAGGYLISRLWTLLGVHVDRAMDVERRLAGLARVSPRLASVLGRPVVQTALLVSSAVAIAVFAWTLIVGPFSLHVAGLSFRNSKLLRPALVAALLLVLGGRTRIIGRVSVALLILVMLPSPAYRVTLEALQKGTLRFRPTRDCVLRVGARPEMTAAGPRGMYVDGDGVDYQLPYNHQFAYYFRLVQPWIRPRDVTPGRLYRFVTDPAEQRPLLIEGSRYHAVLEDFRAAAGKPISLPRVTFHDDVMIVLPGPYAVCGAEHMDYGRHR